MQANRWRTTGCRPPSRRRVTVVTLRDDRPGRVAARRPGASSPDRRRMPCLASTGASPFAVRQPRPPAHREEAGAADRGREGPRRRGPELRVRRRGGPVREGRRPPRGPLRQGPRLPAGPRLLGRRPTGRAGAARSRRRRPARCAARPARPTWPAPGPGSPARDASTSRASTTPSWSRRSGATTCAIEGVVVEPLHGVDDLPAIVKEFRPTPGTTARRAGRPPGDGLEGVPDRRADHRRARPRRRPPVHRHLAGGQAVRSSASRPGRSMPEGPAVEGRRLHGAGLGGRHRLRLGAADPRPRAAASPTSSRNCSAGWKN